MKHYATGALAFGFLLVGSASADATDFSMTTPTVTGTGCPTGHASSTLSPDKKSLSVLFDNYIVDAGGTTHKRVANKFCRIVVPVKLPVGSQMVLEHLDFRGFNSVPGSGSASRLLGYAGFIPGNGRATVARGSYVSKRWDGPIADNYELSGDLQNNYSSPCGGTAQLIVYTTLSVKTNSANDAVEATVDSLDIASSGGVTSTNATTLGYRIIACQ